jgi:hypothetical protein
MKQLYILAAALLVSATLQAQVQVYSTGFDNAAQQMGWQQYRKGFSDPFYEWDYVAMSFFSSPNCLAHNYPVGGSQATDDWFVSPAFGIPTGGTLDSLRYAFSGFGVPAAGDTVFLYLLNGSSDPDLATQTILYEFSGLSYQNDNTWRRLDPITLPAQSGNSYFAFRYRTVNNWLDVRFDNLAISKNSAAGLNENLLSGVTASPNPFTESITVTLPQEDDYRFTLRDAAGRIVREESHMKCTQFTLHTERELPAGCYFLQVESAEASVTLKLAH